MENKNARRARSSEDESLSKSADNQSSTSDEEDDETLPKEVTMFAESMPPDEQEKVMKRTDAQKLMKYEAARGKQNWKIKDGQNIEFKDGRISRTSTQSAQDTE